jgi:predicted Rossmann-fold nucleotide-binding protein
VKGDLDRLVRFLQRDVPAPVGVFGSARLMAGGIDFLTANAVGANLAAAGLVPITGGGPSIMTWVPEAFQASIARRGLRLETQSASIKVPHEPGVSESIDVHEEFSEFLFRKLALYHKAIGLLVMPGGIGTMDELTEVWAQAARKQHGARLATVRNDFWRPLLSALERVAVHERPLISRSAWSRLESSDAVSALIRSMAEKSRVGPEPVDRMAARMGCDLDQSLYALDRAPRAVTVLGGRGLAADDPTLAVVREACRRLSPSHALRVGNPIAVGDAVVEGARAGSPVADVQGMMLRGEEAPRGVRVLAEQSDFIVHKDVLTRHISGLIALPGGLGTISNLFAVLTEMQTGRRERVPVVLVGSSFWQPIKDALKEGMLNEHRRMISPEDLDMLVVTDDPARVAAAMAAPAREAA